VRFKFLLVILAFCITSYSHAGDGDGNFTLYLVRHAEKQDDGSRDPALTETGNRRAVQLAEWLSDKDIGVIWSSDYKRTRDTAKPLLTESGLELSIYDPRDLPSLSTRLLQQKHNAYVVGHSNTTPDLARLLCQCAIDDMNDTEYDRLIEITLNDGRARVRTIRQDQLSQH
jgi:phosphohistidine phosphatase SixA